MSARRIDHASVLARAVLGWVDEVADQGIMITDGDLVIRRWNRWLATYSGRPAVEMVGRPLLEAWPELAARTLDQDYRDALAGRVRVVSQALHAYVFPMRPTLGPDTLQFMPQSGQIAPLVVDGLVVGTITVIEDVSERRLTESALRAQIAALEVANRTAEAAVRAKDEFLATLSHELRTPLTSVLGWSRILRQGGVDQSGAVHGLEVIERNSQAQLRLIEDMLDISRLISGKLRLEMQPTDLSATALAAIDAVAPVAAAKGVLIRPQIGEDMPTVLGDADRLQQVVWNLLTNAVKFTPSGGTIDVKLERAPGRVRLTVKDTGEGISADFLPHLFERFRQADGSSTRRHGGLGLGLALVRQFVELHGGTVGVESGGAGQGAVFRVELPARGHAPALPSPQPGGTTERASHAHGTPLQGVCAVIVDDEADMREILKFQLEALGAEAVVAATSVEGLTAVTDCVLSRGVTVLIADIAMPGDDGLALIRKVRALPPEQGGRTAAIALTAYAAPENRARALSAGFHHYLVKPIDVDMLVATIQAATSGAGDANVDPHEVRLAAEQG